MGETYAAIAREAVVVYGVDSFWRGFRYRASKSITVSLFFQISSRPSISQCLARLQKKVCCDQMIEPVLYSNNVGRVNHIRDPAPMDWSDQDRRKHRQVELQALLGGPIPADTQLVIRALGQRSFKAS
jgi:hypothetical protein